MMKDIKKKVRKIVRGFFEKHNEKLLLAAIITIALLCTVVSTHEISEMIQAGQEAEVILADKAEEEAILQKNRIQASEEAKKLKEEMEKIADEEAAKQQAIKEAEEAARKQAEADKAAGIIYIHGWKYQLQPGELEFFKKVLCAESGGSSREEQLATTNVILNRTRYNESTLMEEMDNHFHYSCVSNGQVYTGAGSSKRLLTTERVEEEFPFIDEVVEEVLYNEYDITEAKLLEVIENSPYKDEFDLEKYATGGALYFYQDNPKSMSSKQWNSRQKIKVSVKIGGHIYYRYWDQ